MIGPDIIVEREEVVIISVRVCGSVIVTVIIVGVLSIVVVVVDREVRVVSTRRVDRKVMPEIRGEELTSE